MGVLLPGPQVCVYNETFKISCVIIDSLRCPAGLSGFKYVQTGRNQWKEFIFPTGQYLFPVQLVSSSTNASLFLYTGKSSQMHYGFWP